ncbi:MAG TPA: [Fe-Fe] hydrogenase large subunit C-terminal domain-containing protein [Magnetospirillaceae bacterium]|nr:[Fe-Fe] hydrogenase large subunit C-terminal domain-containing protein [Magnetospirillaceae bacterium]
MDILNPIYTEKAECQDCYKCVRACPVKSIRIEGGRASVVPELCVLCGRCVQVCPVGAKRVRDDLSRVRRFLEQGQPVTASLAPSFTAEYPGAGPERISVALRRLGFAAVSETALGADLVSEKIARMLMEGSGTAGGRVLISSACPTVVEHIKKYHVRFADRVTEICSPLLAHARLLKREYGRETKVVFIGPCISKKRESDLHKDILDAAITFQDLSAWLDSEGIRILDLVPGNEDRFQPARAAKGTLYPVDGGMIASIRKYETPPGVRWMCFSGIPEIDRALSGFSEAEIEGTVFLELLACPGGCVNGPCVRSAQGTIAKRLRIQKHAETAADRGSFQGVALESSWFVKPVPFRTPDRDELEEALRKTGKHTVGDELNCSGCGYDTCRDFAAAMVDGRAEASMCVSNMRRLAQNKASGLLRSIPSGVVIVDQDLRIVECNRRFAQILGTEMETVWDAKPGMEGAELCKLVPFHRYFREVLDGADALERDMRFGRRVIHGTVFCIERGGFAGGVFQDITSPWIRKDRVVTQARKVIEKNLAVVQKIAFLLGENAAESEAILTSIIESFEVSREEPGT